MAHAVQEMPSHHMDKWESQNIKNKYECGQGMNLSVLRSKIKCVADSKEELKLTREAEQHILRESLGMRKMMYWEFVRSWLKNPLQKCVIDLIYPIYPPHHIPL